MVWRSLLHYSSLRKNLLLKLVKYTYGKYTVAYFGVAAIGNIAQAQVITGIYTKSRTCHIASSKYPREVGAFKIVFYIGAVTTRLQAGACQYTGLGACLKAKPVAKHELPQYGE